jgi:crotonobetainyl-CoA:carnitine CoA-transferase CaiB-like acyl-CoA transferase
MGQLVEVPMVEVALNVAAEQVITYTAYGHILQRQGNRGPGAPQGVYRCAGEDQWAALAVETDAQWEALARVIGQPPWAASREYTPRAGRRLHHDALDRELGTWFSDRDRDRVVEQLLEAGVPAAPVWNHMVLDELPRLVDTGFFQRLTHPVVGGVALPGIGLRSADVDFGYERPAPTLGQHTAAVLREKLGCDDAELTALVAEGAIGPV